MQPNESEARPWRVLIVDDEEDIAYLLSDALTRRGFDTYIANDAAGALQLTEDVAPDIALLDLALPDLDGCELAQRLFERHGTALRAVAITAFSDKEHVASAMEAGFAAYIVKPIRLDGLTQLLESFTTESPPPVDAPH